MKFKLSPNTWHNILKALLFTGVIIIISYLLPNQDTFKYQFEIGKPWSYDLITASFDFPVYKSEKQIQEEKSALLENFVPYFKLDTSVMHAQYLRFIKDYYEKSGEEYSYSRLIQQKFKTAYDNPIIASDQYQKLKEENVAEIN